MSVTDTVPSSECLNCGYDLASGAGGVLVTCPECGTAAPERYHQEWRDKVARLGLTLALWGVPCFALAGLASRRSMGSVSISSTSPGSGSSNGSGTWSVSNSAQGALELAGVVMVLMGVVCLQRTATGRRATWWILGVAAVLGLIEFGTAMQTSTIYPWNALGIAQNSWPDRIRDWMTSGAYAAVGGILLYRVSSLMRQAGLPVMARWGPRIAIAVMIVGVASPVVEWIGREIWTEWTTNSARTAMQAQMSAARSKAAPMQFPAGPTSPWYVSGNAAVVLFWTAPLKAGVLAAMWGFLLVARMRLTHMTGMQPKASA